MMKNRTLFELLKFQPDTFANNTLLLGHLESLATIDDDALQKRFLKELIRNYVALEKQLDSLLKNTLPTSVAEELKTNNSFPPRAYTCTILFTDFIGFTKLSEIISRSSMVNKLNTIFTEFDIQVDYFKGTKIKTIGDAYMAVFGAPVKYDDHAVRAVRAALTIVQYMQRFNLDAKHPFHMRVGIHTGRVMAGVVGRERMQFDVFGDDVNIASRFESASIKNKINVSETTYKLTKDYFDFEKRGAIQLKNKADMKAYFVLGEKS